MLIYSVAAELCVLLFLKFVKTFISPALQFYLKLFRGYGSHTVTNLKNSSVEVFDFCFERAFWNMKTFGIMFLRNPQEMVWSHSIFFRFVVQYSNLLNTVSLEWCNTTMLSQWGLKKEVPVQNQGFWRVIFSFKEMSWKIRAFGKGLFMIIIKKQLLWSGNLCLLLFFFFFFNLDNLGATWCML